MFPKLLSGDETPFRRAFDTAGHGMAIVGLDGFFIEANGAFAEIVGYLPQELMAMDFHRITHPDDLALDLDHLCRLRSGEVDSYRIDKRYIRKDGRVIWTQLDVATIDDTGGQPVGFVAQIQDVTARKRAERGLEDVIRLLAGTLELRDPYTAGHQRHVSNLAAAIAEGMSLSTSQCQTVRLAANVHDIGKVRVPAEILSRPGRLSPFEIDLIKCHPQTGYELLNGIDFPWPIAEITLQHHERMDGSGYPNGLRASEILLEARIIAVADVVEAMSTHRPYRAAQGLDAALQELDDGRAVRYDPDVVDAARMVLGRVGLQLDDE